MTTLREHLESIRDLADAEPPRTHDIYRRANEALKLLNDAEIEQVAADGPLIFCRLIRDNVTEDQWKNQWSVSE